MIYKAKIISGMSVDAIGSIASLVVGIAVLPFYFNYISQEQYGLWLAISGLVALISVVDMGADQYLMTIVSNDKKFFSKDIGSYVLSTLVIKTLVSLLFLIVGLVVFIFLPLVIKIESAFLSIAKQTFTLSLLLLILNLYSGTISTIAYARHHLSLVNGLASLSSVLTSIGTILLLSLGFDIIAFPVSLLLFGSLQLIYLLYYSINKYPHIEFNIKNYKFQNIRPMMNFSFSFQVLKLLFMVRTQYIAIAINNLVGPSAVASYNLTSRLVQMVPVFSSKIALPFFPSFSKYFAINNIRDASEIFTKINKIIFRFSIFSIIICVSITKPFVVLWVGSSAYAGNGILALLCIYALIISCLSGFGIVIYSSKNFEKWSFISFIEIIFIFLLSYLFSINYGFIGIVFGFVCASLISQVYLFIMVLNQLKISYKQFLLNVFFYAVRSNISTLIFAVVIINLFPISSWTEIIICCLLFVVINLISYEGFLVFNSKELGLRRKLRSVLKL